MEYAPVWRRDASLPEDVTTESIPAETDLAVVGAGYTGLAAALAAAGSDLRITVLDAGSIGGGASSVNGGMVNIGLKAPAAWLLKRFGKEAGRAFWDSSIASIDLVERIVQDEGIDCHFARPGAAKLGHAGRDFDRFGRSAAWMREALGFDAEVVPQHGIRSVVGSDRFRAALVDTVGAGLQPAAYVFGLAETVARKGVSLIEHARVDQIHSERSGFELTTSKGKLRARDVLLATNGYTTSRPEPRLRRRVVPVGSYIVATAPLDGALAERLIPRSRMLWTARRLLNYFRRTPDDRILFGGRNNLSTDLDLRESARILRRSAVDVFPELHDVAFTHAWGGRLGVTFDLMPHIGRIDGMWYALGYGGHGVGIATYVGTEVGRLIAGKLDRSPFAEIPHPTRVYYRDNAWFLPAAARWYRILDRLGV